MSGHWQDLAACKGATSLFFPTPNGAIAVAETRAAKAVCARCPVTAECLELGIEERFGIWGGTTEQERRVLRRQRKAEVAA